MTVRRGSRSASPARKRPPTRYGTKPEANVIAARNGDLVLA